MNRQPATEERWDKFRRVEGGGDDAAPHFLKWASVPLVSVGKAVGHVLVFFRVVILVFALPTA